MPIKTSSSDDILDDSDESEDHAKQVTDFLAQLEREEKLEARVIACWKCCYNSLLG